MWYGSNKHALGYGDNLDWHIGLGNFFSPELAGLDVNKVELYRASDLKLSGAITQLLEKVNGDLELQEDESYDENEEDLDDDYDDCSYDDDEDDNYDEGDIDDPWVSNSDDSSDFDYKIVQVDGRKFKLTPID
jgi:hypothetical protein